MLMTSSAINKRIRNLEDEKDLILGRESEARVYTTVAGYEDVIPEYDFAKTQSKVSEIDRQVRKLKHAVNVMNSTTNLEHFPDMTVDEALVCMAQLNKRKETLDKMRRTPPKARVKNRYGESNNLVEYSVVNYGIEEVEQEYNRIIETVQQLQMDIDFINQTVKIVV